MTQAPVDIPPTDLAEVWRVLNDVLPQGAKVWVFGSRAKYTTRDASDLDLAIDATRALTRREVSALSDLFEESDLPYSVDVVDMHTVSAAFRGVIDRDKVRLPRVAPGGEKGAAGEWNSTTLGECATWLSGGTPFKGNDTFWSGSIPWVSAKDMKTFRLHDAEDHISPLAVGNGGKLVPAGAILLLVRGMTLHNDVPICMITREMAFNQDIKALRPAKNVDGAFLAYWLLAHKPALLASVDHAGHGTGRLVTDTLKQKPVRLPPLPEQKRIAGILGALDDKIELNRRMNATLEAIARAVFKSWFVDFDPVRANMDRLGQPSPPTPLPKVEGGMPAAPDSFQDSELGPIPRGWTVGTLGDIGTNARRGVQPDDIAPNTPYIALEHMPRRSIALGDWDDSADVASGKSAFRKGEILFGKLRPYFHKVGVAPFDGVCSTDILVLAPKSPEWFGFLLGHASSDELIQFTDLASTGTKMPRTNWSNISSFKVALPPKPIAAAFTRNIQPLLNRIHANLHQSRTLTALRDTLLPKLLSGELQVVAHAVSKSTCI